MDRREAARGGQERPERKSDRAAAGSVDGKRASGPSPVSFGEGDRERSDVHGNGGISHQQ